MSLRLKVIAVMAIFFGGLIQIPARATTPPPTPILTNIGFETSGTTGYSAKFDFKPGVGTDLSVWATITRVKIVEHRSNLSDVTLDVPLVYHNPSDTPVYGDYQLTPIAERSGHSCASPAQTTCFYQIDEIGRAHV